MTAPDCGLPGTGKREFAEVLLVTLYVVMHVREHEIFTREDDDLYCDVPISFATAALGRRSESADASGPGIVEDPGRNSERHPVPVARSRCPEHGHEESRRLARPGHR